jgi:chromate transporter
MRRGTVTEVFLAFLSLGCTSFGGPVAHLGYFRTEFVERRKWLDDAAYADLVALCQFLPGPASSQVGIALGKLRAGYPGAIAAFIAFTLPSVLLLLAVAYGATALTGPWAEGALHGLKVAALAVVAQALWAMAKSLTPDWPRRAMALATAGLALLFPSGVTQVALIAAAALVGAARPAVASPLAPPRRADLAWLGLFFLLLVALPLVALTGDPTLTIAEKFYRTGSLVFGGGHVVLPLLEAELVGPGLIPRDLFLAGYGAAQAVPGPLFSFAAYTGALLTSPPNGIWGATLALVMIYLPSFFLVFAALDWWQSLRRNERLRNGLNLANAAVVGLLLATLYDPVATSSITGWVDVAWALAALALLFRKVPPPLVVLASALLGIGLTLV